MKRYALVAIAPLALLVGCQTVGPADSPLGPLNDASPLPHFDNRVETWTDKTVVVFTPHPDDDTFGCAGTMAILAKNKNRVIVVIYTNDDKGSHDPEMTSPRLATIRKTEEENACRALGIGPENILWLNHPDGMLEYVPEKQLCKEAARMIRKYKPDAIFSIDPGTDHERWHKSDHRAAAFVTVDAVRAARWHLYFPELLEKEKLAPHDVPTCYFYYSTEPNYAVDINNVADLKLQAALAHESQFPPAIDKYQPMPDQARSKLTSMFKLGTPRRFGRCVEYFRRADNQY